jgi:NAD(P)-dependent dehydrogenase (short-subunit alcohol dehydrogenase family)
MKGHLMVLGATGGIGSAVVAAGLDAGYRVIAVARDEEGLRELVRVHEGRGGLTALRGSFETESEAAQVSDEIRALRVRIDGVIAAMSEPLASARLLERSAAALTETFERNVGAHFIAAKHLLPLFASGGRGTDYLVLGCATADFAWAGYGHVSICAAARKMLVQVLREESKDLPVRIQLVQIEGRVCTPKNARGACRSWAGADLVGRQIVELVGRNDAAGVVHLHASAKKSTLSGDGS